ncbi:MAG: hypothetical protein PHY72_01955 [Candidatus Pacebacteria bacterium]|nr:hypothetical protein [Candidatus Paceibacterota bacterium]
MKAISAIRFKDYFSNFCFPFSSIYDKISSVRHFNQSVKLVVVEKHKVV